MSGAAAQRSYGRLAGDARLVTLLSLAGALAFVAGSVLLFFPDADEAVAVLFLIGSLCFLAEAGLRALRRHGAAD